MPHALDSGDRKLLIAAAALLAVLLIATSLLSPKRLTGTSSNYPSSYSADWDGAKGAYLLLQDLGYHVARWEQSPEEIDGEAQSEVLILTQPLEPPSEEEKSAILEFLQKGGRVVATGWGA